MPTKEFRKKVLEIAGSKGWFQALNVYASDEPIFNIETVNYGLADTKSGNTTSELAPLYCVAVSAKRYVLYNKDPKEGTVIRKLSAFQSSSYRFNHRRARSGAPILLDRDGEMRAAG